ncbi:carbon-nitrogen hydrolase family protein [Shimia ponticola]|uniref:carbon-nitrogen hydrolase family protein n=1 Tax=Shimia ponticola TaxID=2582893 RepID=UPI0011BD85FC|nr:carbon-nitrogen hydrolase family protein [Shimia ponticola]
MRAALLQTNSSDDVSENRQVLVQAVVDAKAAGADILLTPEVSNCVSSSRSHQQAVLALEEDDTTLAAIQAAAREHGIWVLLGSLALLTGDADGRFANRSILIDDSGSVQARYDKLHMFDVTLSDSEAYRESEGYRPGADAVVAQTPFARLGLTICYDVRFPYLHRALAQAGAQVITVPAAFAVPTGQAHWEVLLRARAIETGCFVLAPAQSGSHRVRAGARRDTYGHSLVVAPWGDVLLDAGDVVGLHVIDLDLSQVDIARRRVPSLQHDRAFNAPSLVASDS